MLKRKVGGHLLAIRDLYWFTRYSSRCVPEIEYCTCHIRMCTSRSHPNWSPLIRPDSPFASYLNSTTLHNEIVMAARTAKIERKTNETQITVSINLDCQPGSGNKQEIEISTGIGFLDHASTIEHYLCILPQRIDIHLSSDVPCSCKTLWDVPFDDVPG